MAAAPRGRVVVVGNGPVGQTTALLLAKWGVEVVLLDSREERDPEGSKAICQQRDVLDVWASLGAGAIAAEGLTWTTARTFHRDREIACWSFVDRGHSPLPPFVNISQSRTEAILDELLAIQPLVDVRWGQEVVSFEQSDAGVTVVCDTGADQRRLEASYAVVTAGARAGRLRESLGVAFEGESFDDRFLICDIRAELPGWERERRFWFDPEWNPDRQVLIHPCPGSVFRIDWQVPADFDLDAERASGRLDRRIRQIVGDAAYEVVWSSVYRFHSRCADRMRVGRVLLAGDCAHLVAPFGARGLNSGVPDAENAAWKLAFVLHGWAPESLLESYHEERHAAAEENLAVTTATMDFLVPRTPADWQVRRELLEAAEGDPALGARVDSGRLAEPYWYVESALTTPDRTRPFAGRPEKGCSPRPAPGILVPDVPVTGEPGVSRLRELARTGLLALCAEGVDPVAVADDVGTATTAPFRVVPIAELDSTGELAAALEARAGEVWLVRPDAHVAAVVGSDDVGAAVRRCVGIRS